MNLTAEIIANYTSHEDTELGRKEQLRMVAHRILDDIGMSDQTLPSHWDDIPGHPWQEWKEEVVANNTRLSYRDWAWHRTEMEQPALDPKPEFSVEITEISKIKLERSFTVGGAIDAKQAFQRAVEMFYECLRDFPADPVVEVVEVNLSAEVETPEGDLFYFTDRDDDDEPFIPENHQEQ